MNIIHVMGMRSSKFGGLERFMLALARELHSQNHKLIIIYESKPTSLYFISELKKHEVDIVIVPARGKSIFSFILTFSKLLFKYKPDIVHCHFTPAAHIALIIAKFFVIKKRFRTLHSMLCNSKQIETISKRELSLKTIILNKLSYQLSTKTFSVSEGIKKQFGQIFGFNKKIETLYLGVNDNELDKHANRVKYKLPIDKLLIVCVAFHDKVKGVDVLLHAIQILKFEYKYENIILCQIGSGNEIETLKLKNIVKELAIDNAIIWMGLQDNVPEILVAADIYCQPSRSEGIALSIMEASMARLPVVASLVGGIPEAVIDNYTGFLVEKENPELLALKLDILLKDTVLRKQFGENARFLALKNFKMENQVSMLLKFYSSN